MSFLYEKLNLVEIFVVSTNNFSTLILLNISLFSLSTHFKLSFSFNLTIVTINNFSRYFSCAYSSNEAFVYPNLSLISDNTSFSSFLFVIPLIFLCSSIKILFSSVYSLPICVSTSIGIKSFSSSWSLSIPFTSSLIKSKYILTPTESIKPACSFPRISPEPRIAKSLIDILYPLPSSVNSFIASNLLIVSFISLLE